MTVAAITGHRPEKIPDINAVVDELKRAYHELGVTHVIQGMAAGVDLASAYAAWVSQIPYTCAKPWAGHTPRVQDKEMYDKVLKHAQSVVDVSPEMNYTGPWLYQTRNIWMVDSANILISVWDGSNGGTANSVRYAFEEGRYVYNINPKTMEKEWLNSTSRKRG